jgi:hypothetical protein
MMLLLAVKSRRRPMISKSKLAAKLSAITFIAAMGAASLGIASTALAAPPGPYGREARGGAATYGEPATGGGSLGYNQNLGTHYRLKQHQKSHHPSQHQPQQQPQQQMR